MPKTGSVPCYGHIKSECYHPNEMAPSIDQDNDAKVRSRIRISMHE